MLKDLIFKETNVLKFLNFLGIKNLRIKNSIS